MANKTGEAVKEEKKYTRKSLKNWRQIREWAGWITGFFSIFLFGIGFFFLPVWLFARHKILAKYKKETKCYECGTVIDLIDRWECACGDITKRHIFSRCPSCKNWISTINCPRCETTLDV